MYDDLLDQTLKQYNLEKKSPYELFFGGDINKAFKVETRQGTYLIKVVDIESFKKNYMYEPDELIFSVSLGERLAKTMLNKGIPTIVALDNNQQKQYIIIDHYIMLIYPFLEMKACDLKFVNKTKLANIAHLLAQIHNLNLPDFPDHAASIKLEGVKLLFSKIKQEKKWQDLKTNSHISNNLKQLYADVEKFIDINCNKVESAIAQFNDLVITHNDIKPKNILWEHDSPVIIDWETAGYMSLSVDYLDTLLSWCLDLTPDGYCMTDQKLKIFDDAYHKLRSPVEINNFVISVYIAKWIAWLNYCINFMENADDKDKIAKNIYEALQVIKYVKDNRSYLNNLHAAI